MPGGLDASETRRTEPLVVSEVMKKNDTGIHRGINEMGLIEIRCEPVVMPRPGQIHCHQQRA